MTMLLPAAHLHAGGYSPAAFVFNGSNEVLQRTLVTLSPNTTIVTISMWIKRTGAATEQCFFVVDKVPTSQARFWMDGGDTQFIEAFDGWWGEGVSSVVPTLDAWEHWVVRYDSTQGTADNRIRIYIDGNLQTDATIAAQPSLNQSHFCFSNSAICRIGANSLGSRHFEGKMAFIEVLEGVSSAPTDFAFDNSGVWTRQTYTGSYGSYGYFLDGTNGFNDVSGNGQHFSGVNMTIGDNLDTGDLPPYTS